MKRDWIVLKILRKEVKVVRTTNETITKKIYNYKGDTIFLTYGLEQPSSFLRPRFERSRLEPRRGTGERSYMSNRLKDTELKKEIF